MIYDVIPYTSIILFIYDLQLAFKILFTLKKKLVFNSTVLQGLGNAYNFYFENVYFKLNINFLILIIFHKKSSTLLFLSHNRKINFIVF